MHMSRDENNDETPCDDVDSFLSVFTIIPTMSTSVLALKHLTRPFLHDLHAWWLRGVPNTYDAAPEQEVMKRWFFRDSTFDTQCR